jgi:hypothetical protein
MRQGNAHIERVPARRARLGLVGLVLTFASGCSTQYMGRVLTPESAETIRATGDPYVTVRESDGERRGRLLEVGQTRSLVRLQQATSKPGMTVKGVVQLQYTTTSVDNSSIREVTAADHGRGALDGFGWGVLGGAALGVVAASAASCLGDCSSGPSGRAILTIGGVLTLEGAFIGTLLGGLIGHRTTYWFE